VKERSLIALDNVYRSTNEISIVPDFISLTKYDGLKIDEERSAKILLTDNLEKRSPKEKSSILDGLLVSRLSDFVNSRAISIKIPITYLDFLNLTPKNGSGKEEGNFLFVNRHVSGHTLRKPHKCI
jgi:hypothetical protein